MLAGNTKISIDARKSHAGIKPPKLIKSRLNDPIKLKRPALIGVQFMGDLFNKDIDWPIIDKVFYACHKADWHTYVFLTKRIEAAWYYFDSPIYEDQSRPRRMFLSDNIYFGTSVENQEMANKRIKILLQIQAAVRFVSVEPMLERVNLVKPVVKSTITVAGDYFSKWINWIVCGAETGPRARPMKLEWARDLRDQCKVAGVPFFFKSAGKQSIPDDLMIREFPN